MGAFCFTKHRKGSIVVMWGEVNLSFIGNKENERSLGAVEVRRTYKSDTLEGNNEVRYLQKYIC
jgi:hypothetical protein